MLKMQGELKMCHKYIDNETKLFSGDSVVCRGARVLYCLTEGKTYTAIYGLEPGVFKDKPYITVINDLGKVSSYHAHRFHTTGDS